MNIQVGKVIQLKNLAPDEYKLITKTLSLVNPAYTVMKRQGNMKAMYSIPEFIKYFEKIPDGLNVGRGVLPRINRHLLHRVDNVCVDLVKPCIDCRVTSIIKLRDYQEGVTEEILPNTEGIIRLDTAFGKSIIAMKLIEETQLKTLIVVPRLDLLKQFTADIKTFCGYEVGTINGPKFDIKDITVATIQTLKQRDLSEISSSFGMCIFDEAHTYISDKGIKVIQSFNPLRLYGMTATDDRSDGQGEAIKFIFGDVIVDRVLPFEKPVVEIIKCTEEIITIKKQINGSDKTSIDYSSIIDSQVNNITRNKLIASIITSELKEGRKILVLTKRVSHCEDINKIIPSCRSYEIKSQLHSLEQGRQDDLLRRLRDGGKDFDVIIGTFGLLSTGINIPALDTIIFAGDLKSSVLATQSIGRILRLFEGKKSPKIIDIDDVKSGILHNQALIRRKFYKSKEWKII